MLNQERPLREVVLQSQAVHPDWDARTHLSYLESECWWVEAEALPNLDTVEGWLDEHSREGLVGKYADLTGLKGQALKDAEWVLKFGAGTPWVTGGFRPKREAELIAAHVLRPTNKPGVFTVGARKLRLRQETAPGFDAEGNRLYATTKDRATRPCGTTTAHPGHEWSEKGITWRCLG